MATQAWRHGIGVVDSKGNPAPKMPEPYYFFWGSVLIGFTGIVAMANQRLGVVMAWGFMLGALVYNYESSKQQAAKTQANSNPTALAIHAKLQGA